MREMPSLRVPKIVAIDIPAPESKVTRGFVSPTFSQHQVIVRVQEVTVDHRTSCTLPVAFVDDDQYMVEHHIYRTWAGRVDGAGSPPFREGGHFFAGSRGGQAV